MTYQIIWSPFARKTYYNNIEYLLEHWSEKEANAFVKRVEEVINFIKLNPWLYPYSQKKDIFKSLVVKQVAMFYRLKNDKVEILLFWDTRQNPSKLKF